MTAVALGEILVALSKIPEALREIPVPISLSHLPIGICRVGKIAQVTGVPETDMRRGPHIRLNFPVCSNSMANKGRTTRHPGGSPEAPPDPWVL